MKVTAGNNVVIDYSGCSDYYNGASVEGAFSGRMYYSLDDVIAHTRLTRDQIIGMEASDICPTAIDPSVTIADMIGHNCKAVRTVGQIIQ